MPLEWKSFLRTDRSGQPVRIIWSERHPDLFEIHAPLRGQAVMYLNGREIAAHPDIMVLTEQAQDMLVAQSEAAA